MASNIYCNDSTTIRTLDLTDAEKLAIQVVRLPFCDHIRTEIFKDFINLQIIIAPRVKYIDKAAFYNCSKLQSIDFPICHSIDADAFNGCSSLISVYLPMCYKLDSGVFNGCKMLKVLSLPYCSHLVSPLFVGCDSLELLELPEIKFIEEDGCETAPFIKTIRSQRYVEATFEFDSGEVYELRSLTCDKIRHALAGQVFKRVSMNIVSMPANVRNTVLSGFYAKEFMVQSNQGPMVNYDVREVHINCKGGNHVALCGINSIICNDFQTFIQESADDIVGYPIECLNSIKDIIGPESSKLTIDISKCFNLDTIIAPVLEEFTIMIPKESDYKLEGIPEFYFPQLKFLRVLEYNPRNTNRRYMIVARQYCPNPYLFQMVRNGVICGGISFESYGPKKGWSTCRANGTSFQFIDVGFNRVLVDEYKYAITIATALTKELDPSTVERMQISNPSRFIDIVNTMLPKSKRIVMNSKIF